MSGLGKQISLIKSLKKNFFHIDFIEKLSYDCLLGLTKGKVFFKKMYMKIHEIQVRVRYAETDQMAVVYHGNYAQYFEMGRVEWLRNQGISYKWMEENGIMLPLVSLTMNYKKPARYDDLLTIRTIFKSQETVKIEFDYEVFNEAGELLTTGNSILVFVDAKTGRPTLPPDYINELKFED